MSTDAPNITNSAIDSALIAEIVRRVIAQLGGDEPSVRAEPVTDQVVSVATIERFAGTTERLNILPRAVVTPAAWDEAKQRGIAIVRAPGPSAAGDSDPQPAGTGEAVNRVDRTAHTGMITDTDQPERAESIAVQLAHRGVSGDARIVLSDRPAAELQRLASGGKRAAMVRCIADVDRFETELRPQIWVLDMIDMNWIAAVNAAARILQNGNTRR